MKLFVTKEYFSKAGERIRDLNATLAKIREEKTAAYNEDTNTWHDNFAYEQLTREEKQTQKLLADLTSEINNMCVVPANIKNNTDKVGLNCSVCVNEENLDTGTETKRQFCIVPLGAEDISKNMYAYNTPLVKSLIGLSVGDEANVRLPSGNILITILSIDKIN